MPTYRGQRAFNPLSQDLIRRISNDGLPRAQQRLDRNAEMDSEPRGSSMVTQRHPANRRWR